MTQITIQQVKELADGSWVNGNVSGEVRHAKNLQTKTGKTMGVAKLVDVTGSIDIQSFDKSFMSVEGKTVELTGAGMRKDSYHAYAKSGVSGTTTMNVIEGGGDMPVNMSVSNPAEHHPGAVQQKNPTYSPSRPATKDDDFVPQQMCHFISAASEWARTDPSSDGVADPVRIANYAVIHYDAHQMAVDLVRSRREL